MTNGAVVHYPNPNIQKSFMDSSVANDLVG